MTNELTPIHDLQPSVSHPKWIAYAEVGDRAVILHISFNSSYHLNLCEVSAEASRASPTDNHQDWATRNRNRTFLAREQNVAMEVWRIWVERLRQKQMEGDDSD